MANSIQVVDTIDGSGYPVCFKTAQGASRPGVLGLGDGEAVYVTQARAMGGHQKEAVVTEGDTGSSWRMVSDEGPALKGTDLAPFPLGFMSAGLQADLLQRLHRLAREDGHDLTGLQVDVFNDYTFEGSFFKGTGVGTAHRPRCVVRAESPVAAAQALAWLRQAAAASPLLAAWRTPLHNTFALYANGHPVGLQELKPSQVQAPDPYQTWTRAPRPWADAPGMAGIVTKTDPVEVKNPTSAGSGEGGRVDIPIHGHGEHQAGLTRSVTWANRLGGSAFALHSDDRDAGDQAPSALAHAFAGVAFCFMTQLLRYVEHHHMKVRALRLVQYSPCRIVGGEALAQPLDTHVFVNTDESPEVMERLMQMSARTCYLHAALGAALAPDIRLVWNGQELPLE